MGLSKFIRRLFSAVHNKKKRQSKCVATKETAMPLPAVMEETPVERHLRLQHAITRLHCWQNGVDSLLAVKVVIAGPSADRPLPTAEKYLTASPYLEMRAKLNATRNLRLVEECDFYWGPINAAQAEQLLAHRPNGSFLLRKSTHPGHLFTLSCVYANRIGHLRILYADGRFSFSQHPTSCRAELLLELINSAVAVSRSGHSVISYRAEKLQRDFDIFLLEPLLKVGGVASLQELCELARLEKNRRDSVASEGKAENVVRMVG